MAILDLLVRDDLTMQKLTLNNLTETFYERFSYDVYMLLSTLVLRVRCFYN